jgi:hypothetical protein
MFSKICSFCRIERPLNQFSIQARFCKRKDPSNPPIESQCRLCKTVHRKKCKPKWVDNQALTKIYIDRPVGHEVDHIVPVKGKNVCGLHVPWNLQYLPKSDNRKKYNIFNG